MFTMQCRAAGRFLPKRPSPSLLAKSYRAVPPRGNRLTRLRHEHPSSRVSIYTHASPGQIPHLQSRFPKKTAITLAVICGLLYWFAEEIEVELDRLDDSLQAGPSHLHFYENTEELDQTLHDGWDSYTLHAGPMTEGIANVFFGRLAKGFISVLGDPSEPWPILPVTHACRFESNHPCEDYWSMGDCPGPGSEPWSYWAVFDGHAGSDMADMLQWKLIPYVSRQLAVLPRFSPSPAITDAIKQAFVRFDDQMMTRAKYASVWAPAASPNALLHLMPVFSGSCALVSMYSAETSTLRVACVGDSRAVLGRWDPGEGKYIAKPLSTDQTGFNEAEVSRIQSAHPGEDDILDSKTGRLLGLAVTRAFGDHRWKWDNEFLREVQYKFWGPAPRPQSKTPPYLTAEPEVTETEVVSLDEEERKRGGKSDFMIMASDGLWDRMSSEHAVELVQRWLEARARGNGSVRNDPQFKEHVYTDQGAEEGLEYDVEKGRYVDWKATPEYFAIEDDNVAICLTKNAMGGSRKSLFLGLLGLKGKISRDAVDDTTVLVVFFDKQGHKKKENEGTVKSKSKSWGWSWKPW